MRETGIYQSLDNIQYFVPHPLPPKDPVFDFNIEIASLYGEVNYSLGRLNEMAKKLPDPTRFIKAYVIKEALLSSEIEGIHTTLLDVFTQPLLGAKPSKDTQLVLNYTKALDVVLDMIKVQGLPIVSRVILAAHEVLMSVGEGDHANPGHYRHQAVRVGNLIPPPATLVPNLIAELEKYINQDSSLPPLIQAGLAHVQFETIHPFLDGNGRIGRLLIVLMLIASNLLNVPILYPSYYFKKNQFEYYQRLDRVRTHGDFEGWIIYYLKCIRDSGLDAYKRAKDIETLESDFKELIQTNPAFLRVQETGLAALNIIFQQPIISTKELSIQLNKTYNSAQHMIERFLELGLLLPVSEESQRNKLYRFEPYLKLLEKEYS